MKMKFSIECFSSSPLAGFSLARLLIPCVRATLYVGFLFVIHLVYWVCCLSGGILISIYYFNTFFSILIKHELFNKLTFLNLVNTGRSKYQQEEIILKVFNQGSIFLLHVLINI